MQPDRNRIRERNGVWTAVRRLENILLSVKPSVLGKRSAWGTTTLPGSVICVVCCVCVCVCMCNVTHDVAGSGCVLERPTLVHSLLIEGIQWKRSCARLRIYTSAAVRSAKPPLLLAPGRPCSAASRLGRGRRYPRPHAPGPSPGSLCVTIRRQM